MIYVPELTLNGNEETLRSRIKACRAPELAWPKEILSQPICIAQRSQAAVVLLADAKEIARVLVEQERDFPKWMPIYRHSAARETGTGTIFASTVEDWKPIRHAIKPFFHSSRWPLLVNVAQQATLDATLTCGLGDIEAFFTAISVDVIFRTLVGDGPHSAADYDIATISKGLVDRQHGGDLRGAMQYIHELADACSSRGPGAAAIEGVDMAGECPVRPRPMAEPYLADNRLALLYAGQETTALTMSWCFWILGQDEELRATLRNECRAAVAAAKGISPGSIGQMPKLTAFIRETLRLLSPSSSTVRTNLAPTTLCGHQIPKDSVIIIPIYAIHRHQTLWERPGVFDAERFLSPVRHPMAFLPFIAGRHTCAASRSVMYEMAAVLATVLDLFDWTTFDAEEMGLTNKLVLSPSSPMKVSVRPLA